MRWALVHSHSITKLERDGLILNETRVDLIEGAEEITVPRDAVIPTLIKVRLCGDPPVVDEVALSPPEDGLAFAKGEETRHGQTLEIALPVLRIGADRRKECQIVVAVSHFGRVERLVTPTVAPHTVAIQVIHAQMWQDGRISGADRGFPHQTKDLVPAAGIVPFTSAHVRATEGMVVDKHRLGRPCSGRYPDDDDGLVTNVLAGCIVWPTYRGTDLLLVVQEVVELFDARVWLRDTLDLRRIAVSQSEQDPATACVGEGADRRPHFFW